MSADSLAVRLVLADRGAFHEVTVRLPADVVRSHERLIDAIREDPRATADVYVDPRRLVAAMVVDDDAA